MNTLDQLVFLCAAEVSVQVNTHRIFYQSVPEYLDELPSVGIPPEIRRAMEEKDTVVEVRFYPHTPVGFLDVYHYDIKLALMQALELAQEARSDEPSNH